MLLTPSPEALRRLPRREGEVGQPAPQPLPVGDAADVAFDMGEEQVDGHPGVVLDLRPVL